MSPPSGSNDDVASITTSECVIWLSKTSMAAYGSLPTYRNTSVMSFVGLSSDGSASSTKDISSDPTVSGTSHWKTEINDSEGERRGKDWTPMVPVPA